jgi:hypothetical protein
MPAAAARVLLAAGGIALLAVIAAACRREPTSWRWEFNQLGHSRLAAYSADSRATIGAIASTLPPRFQ